MNLYYAAGKYALYACSLHPPVAIEGSIPAGPGIVVANHRSWRDPVILAYATKEEISFLAKIELCKSKCLEWYLGRTRMIVVNRQRPLDDIKADCDDILYKGGLLGIFAEGTRNHQHSLLPFKTSAARLALEHDVPIIPVGIRNSERFFFSAKVGEPIRPTGDYKTLTERVRQDVARLTRY